MIEKLLILFVSLTVICQTFGWLTATGRQPLWKTTSLAARKSTKAVQEEPSKKESVSNSANVAAASVEKKKNGDMEMVQLPNSDLTVSRLGLGTMTFGNEQVSESQAIYLLDEAVKDCGINLIDTSELNPTPYAQSTYGLSDRIVGKWLRQQSKGFRDEVVISAKLCAFSNDITWARGGNAPTRINKEQVFHAVDCMLERLQTSHVDILSFQWPDRYVPLYNAGVYQKEREHDCSSFLEQLEIVSKLVDQKKVRYFGLSNESPYGIGCLTTAAELRGLPRPITLQRSYNLLERNEIEPSFEEACAARNGNVAFLAYSPLAGGSLTGKYLDPVNSPAEARMRRFIGLMSRYVSAPVLEAVREYEAIAKRLDMPLAVLALTWIFSRGLVTSALVGVTNSEQLRENVRAVPLAPLSEDILAEIDDIYFSRHRDPTRGAHEVFDPTADREDPSKLPWGAKDMDLDPALGSLLDFKKL